MKHNNGGKLGNDGDDMALNTASQTGKPVSVLFVCLGNICRSPMAEGVFRDSTSFGTSDQHPSIAHIDSCGTGAYHEGESPDPRTMKVLRANNITGYKHAARKVRVPEDFEEFDYVLAMDQDNLENLRDMVMRGVKRKVISAEAAEEMKKKVMLYGAFGGKSKKEEVVDPYYGGGEGFEIAFEQMGKFGKGLISHIEAEAKKAVDGR